MIPDIFFELLTVGCIITYITICLIGVAKGRIKPLLATWVFFSLASALSVITDFRQTGVAGLQANLFNITDMLAVTTGCVAIFFGKHTRRQFDRFELFCLSAVGLIFIGWCINGQNIAANLEIQLILIIAYIPTLVHLWKARHNTESLSMWCFDLAASASGLVIPLRTSSFLPIVYGTRSMICTFIVILLILRIKHKNQINAGS